jgi:DNA-sulfur modification-associated
MVESSKEAQDLLEIRKEVQRRFAGAKEKNVPKYADYLIDVHHGKDGTTPAIMLFSQDQLQVESTRMVQASSKSRGRSGPSRSTARGSWRLGTTPPTAILPRSPSSSRCTFRMGRKACGSVSASMILMCWRCARMRRSVSTWTRDPLTRVTREIESRVPFLQGRVNKVSRQLKKNDVEVATISSLRGACVTFAGGIGAVKYGTRPAPIADDRLPQITERAVSWFQAVTDLIGPALEDREKTVAAAPAVLAAIGAMGHELLTSTDEADRSRRQQRQLEKLSSVNWTRDKHWEGIAGKFTPKGVLSIGGSKETAYAVYAALSDAPSVGYQRIRSSSPAVS